MKLNLKSKKRISIMVPALNEQDNIEKTVLEIEKGLKGKLDDYEILIFDDGSKDRTGKIADELSKKNRKIKVIHHKSPQGMGSCYREGLAKAKFENYMYIPGDNQFPANALSRMLSKIGTADIIIPYVTNMNIRPLARQILSSSFTLILNLAFGLNVSYYNGTVIHRTDLLKTALPKTDGHAYQAEILVRLLKKGASFTEIGYDMYERKGGKTSAFKWKNVKSVFSSISNLFWEVQLEPLLKPS